MVTHLTKFGCVNLSRLIQTVMKTRKPFYASLMVSHSVSDPKLIISDPDQKLIISGPDPQNKNQEFRIRILDPDPSVNK